MGYQLKLYPVICQKQFLICVLLLLLQLNCHVEESTVSQMERNQEQQIFLFLSVQELEGLPTNNLITERDL